MHLLLLLWFLMLSRTGWQLAYVAIKGDQHWPSYNRLQVRRKYGAWLDVTIAKHIKNHLYSTWLMYSVLCNLPETLPKETSRYLQMANFCRYLQVADFFLLTFWAPIIANPSESLSSPCLGKATTLIFQGLIGHHIGFPHQGPNLSQRNQGKPTTVITP